MAPELPVTLRTFLEAGCDLTAVPGLENYARIIVIGHHEMPEDHKKERLVDFFWSNLSEWLEGRSVEMPDGTVVEPSFEVIRHAMWLCEGLNVDEVAEMFEAAIPADLRATCWERINEIRGGSR